ncbi:50S ribosomal protein L7/L12 [Candidatus Riesia pediculicola]|uniref:50S ribosomal protein L7/L12 n=1 Tax=Candidatus Riesia pediculicola TaxID=401619 RepID=UPI0009C1F566|nr:50S ribosomal protein L7/L12 [Candidatus Riesia pediculicola]ARC54315.1 50S ribosomal protein L7/L12 [Candidatus Riesia pediculicola]
MSINKKEIFDAILNMSMVEIIELTSMLEKKFNIDSSVIQTSSIQKDQPEEKKPEKSEFKIILTSFGSNKIAVIKAVRSVISLGLKEAKDIVESCPSVLKDTASKEDVEIIKKALEKSGASITIE